MTRSHIITAAIAIAGAFALFTASQAEAKKAVAMECTAFEVGLTKKGQQKREAWQGRVIPAGWTVVGGGAGPITETQIASGTYVMACREAVEGSGAEE